ncbi:hypothetical protein GCM10022226_74610 [Sphaerisporangium flaviroseum]|uniref:PH domain-containing protein n=1 Tax=Sphaerisporangium flaviroseum TaxID=509199 RepID=A0ABP7JCM6_9ACTN
MSNAAVTFRPRLGRRLITCIAPVVGMAAAAAVAGGLPLALRGLQLLGVMALGVAVGAVLAIRNAMVGITFAPDQIVVVNGFKTIRIPINQLERFEWSQGLYVASHGAGDSTLTPVDAFNTSTNPMAEPEHGYEVWRQLEALRTSSGPAPKQPSETDN